MHKAQYYEMNQLEDTYWWFLGKRLFIDALLTSAPRKKLNILDIGCGTGGNLKHLSKWGSVRGIEKNKYAACLAQKKGFNVIQADANHIPFTSNSFNVVTILDVLYHKGVNEKKVIHEAKRVLKKGGLLLVTDCALPFLWSAHDLAMDAKKRYYKHELVTVITQADFNIIKASYIYFFTFPFFLLTRLVIPIIGNKKSTRIASLPLWINELLLYIVKLEVHFFKYIDYSIGSSVIISARKQ